MTAIAIVFMLLAMGVIWGGLTVALIFLSRNPLEPEDDDEPPGAAVG